MAPLGLGRIKSKPVLRWLDKLVFYKFTLCYSPYTTDCDVHLLKTKLKEDTDMACIHIGSTSFMWISGKYPVKFNKE
jgi:hypothetical protein